MTERAGQQARAEVGRSRWLADEALTTLREAQARSRDRGERFMSWYVGAFATLTVVTMAGGGITSMASGAGCTSLLCTDPTSRPIWSLGLALMVFGGLLWSVALAGPVSADPARLAWLHTTAADRSALLRTVLAGALTLATASGLAGGLLVALAASGTDPQGLAAGGLLGAATGAAAAAATVTVQSSPVGTEPVRLVGRAATAVGALVLAVAAVGLRVPALGGHLWAWATAAVVTVVALAVVRAAASRLGQISGAELRRRGEVVGAVNTAVLMMDGTAVSALGSRRRAGSAGRYRSRRGRGRGLKALAARDARRLARRPGIALAALVALPLPAALAPAIDARVGLLAAAVGGIAVAKAASEGLQAWTRSPGLRRSFALRQRDVRLALLVAPLALTLLWSSVAVALTGEPTWLAVPITLAGAVGALASARPGGPADVGALVATPMGALPAGLATKLVSGLGLGLLGVVPVLLTRAPVTAVVVVGLLVWQLERD